MRASLRLSREIRCIEDLFEISSEVSNADLNRVDDCHSTLSGGVEILADAVLQQTEANNVLVTVTGDRHQIAEIIDADRSVTTSAHALDCQETRIIPSVDMVAEDKSLKSALGKNSVGDVQTRELPDVRSVHVETLQVPVIEFSSDFEFECAEREADTFK